MKHWITALLSAGLLASFGLVATAADNITIQFDTNTTDSLFLITDNTTNQLFQVKGDGTISIGGDGTISIGTDDNVIAKGGKLGPVVATIAGNTTRTLNLEDSPYVVTSAANTTLTLPSATGTGNVFTIFPNNTYLTLKIGDGDDETATYNNSPTQVPRIDCIDIPTGSQSGAWSCFPPNN